MLAYGQSMSKIERLLGFALLSEHFSALDLCV